MKRPKVKPPTRIYAFGTEAFVKHPVLRGMWLKTDVSVCYVKCPYCSAVVGEPCRSKNGWMSATHHLRRKHWTKTREECLKKSALSGPIVFHGEVTERRRA